MADLRLLAVPDSPTDDVDDPIQHLRDVAAAMRRARLKTQDPTEIAKLGQVEANALKALAAVETQAATKAIIYLRVSTGHQASSGLGMEAQEAACRAQAARMGLDVVAVHADEAMSGTDAPEDRPGLMAAIRDWRSSEHDTVVVVYSLSRLARRQKVLWGLLDDRDGMGLPVTSATEPFDTSTAMGRAMLGMLGVWAALESDLASDRTRAALQAAKARGTKLGAPSSADLLPAWTIERVEELRGQGLSYAKVADALNADKVPGPTGGSWHPSVVRSICVKAA